MPTAASQIYARQLLPQKRGYPLFVPEPSKQLPDAYKQKGVSIGDVGVIAQDGSFAFAFNACAAADESVNCHGVPAGFKPFTINRDRIARFKDRGSEVVSSSIQKESLDGLKENDALHGPAGISVCYRLSSSCSEAAVLTLPDGASCEDYQSLAELRTHAIRNAVSWYEFINGHLGFEARNGSVYFVTGYDKATTWGIAAVSNAAASASPSSRVLRFTAAQRANPRDAYSYSWDTDCPASVRTGPDSGQEGVRLPQNQCLFVRGFKIMLRERPTRRATSKGPARAVSTRNMKRKSDVVHGGKTDKNFFPGSKSLRANYATTSTSSHRRHNSGMSDSSMSSPPSDDSYFSDDSDGDLDPNAGIYHPLDIINRSILEMTQADVVITHDSDWWSLSKNDTFDSGEHMLQRLWSWYEARTGLGKDGLKYAYLSEKQVDSDSASNMDIDVPEETQGTHTSKASYSDAGNLGMLSSAALIRRSQDGVVVDMGLDEPTKREETPAFEASYPEIASSSSSGLGSVKQRARSDPTRYPPWPRSRSCQSESGPGPEPHAGSPTPSGSGPSSVSVPYSTSWRDSDDSASASSNTPRSHTPHSHPELPTYTKSFLPHSLYSPLLKPLYSSGHSTNLPPKHAKTPSSDREHDHDHDQEQEREHKHQHERERSATAPGASPSPKILVATTKIREASKNRRTHSAKVICSICHNDFTTTFARDRHMISHTTRRDYPCTKSGCNQRFSTDSGRKRHEKSPTLHK